MCREVGQVPAIAQVPLLIIYRLTVRAWIVRAGALGERDEWPLTTGVAGGAFIAHAGQSQGRIAATRLNSGQRTALWGLVTLSSLA